MTPLAISLAAFGCIFAGLVIGMVLRLVLPEHHLSDESKDAVKLGIGMIATLAALVLGLLIASAKASYDKMNTGLIETGAKIILLDRIMARYGSETDDARALLRRSVASAIDRFWSTKKPLHRERKDLGPGGPNPKTGLECVQENLLRLSPQNETQRRLLPQALQTSNSISEVRWLLTEQQEQSSLPMPFFVILVLWLVIIFFGFGIISPPNATVIAVLLVCSLSTAAALYMILELDNPYGGIIEVSSAPLRNALTYLGR